MEKQQREAELKQLEAEERERQQDRELRELMEKMEKMRTIEAEEIKIEREQIPEPKVIKQVSIHGANLTKPKRHVDATKHRKHLHNNLPVFIGTISLPFLPCFLWS